MTSKVDERAAVKSLAAGPAKTAVSSSSMVVESGGLASAGAPETGKDKKPASRQKRATVALALGSGGARGYAHIGAIEVLNERGYEIIAISGCSMGALVGGMYAAGKLQQYKDWVTGLGQFDVLRLLDVTFSAVGAIRGEKIFSIVSDILGDTRIEDLPIAFTSVATDLLGHKEIWFQEGPLDQAIRASVAIPGVVTPLVLNGRVLVDGATLNPLPIIPTISAHADLIVAVNLAGEEDRSQRLLDAAFTSLDDDDDSEEWMGAMREKASRWFDWDTLKGLAGGKVDGEPAEDKISREVQKQNAKKQRKQAGEEAVQSPKSPGPTSTSKAQDEGQTINWEKLGIGKFEVMNLAIETMQSVLVQYKIAGYPPDLLVNIPKNVCRSYDFHKAPELIQLGRERMSAALDRYEQDHSSSGPLAV
ncbi:MULTISPECIES: patatin-like phospholipase family protein [unclassified Marinobacter]|uniref:patatin-like phospholipase family protein n=1 Tax=unclassified Marinobacter TaxID=83889 RepID=UPI002010565C|nr:MULTISPECIES: patatin-like phospholipase family protein [unclassified Marinobacter]UQG54121.1 patatin-like phospholipase family protein [Marinobacter sp. M4C]UQG62928.1 patatin-like phospholipase family protein [Marinobacter sp. M2C]UQG67206.1 patatin-like phospholipase family protein [Marinobacter sp. M1C]